jgi:lysophospholipase L1-like esterase
MTDTWLDKIKAGEHVTLDFVGDSVTHGLNHCRPEETYVAKIAALLARRFPTHTVRRFDGIQGEELKPLEGFDGPILVSAGSGGGVIDVIRNGVGGNTVRRAHNRIQNFTGVLANGRTPDVTFLMLGINDSLDNDPAQYVPVDVYGQQYKALLADIRRHHPEAELVILSSTYNGESIRPYCECSKALAAEEGIPYVDLFAFWMAHYDPSAPHFGQGDWLSDCAWDACHPTPVSAEATAAYILDALLTEDA